MAKKISLGDGMRIGRRLARQLAPHARDQKGAIGATLVISVLVLALRMAQPWPVGWIYDHLSLGAAKLPGSIDLGGAALTILCAAYLALSLLAAFSEYGQLMYVGGVVNRTVYAFRQRLFGQVLRLSLKYHEKREVGELITRVVSDTSRLRRGLVAVVLRGARNILIFLATVTVLFCIDPVLSTVALACGLLAGVRMILRSKVILKTARKNRKKEGLLAGLVEENLQGIRELQTYRADGSLDPRFDRENAKSLKTEQKLRKLEAGLLVFVDAVLSVALCAVVWVGTTRVTGGTLTPGTLVMFLIYLTNLYRPFAQFARQASKTGRILACADRVVSIAEKKPDVADRPDAVPAPAFSGAVAFEGVVAATFGSDGEIRRLLSDASFRIEPGQRVAVLGPNGAGKSTLLRHVLRLADPQSGRVLVDGRDVREYTLASFRGQFSVVQQDPSFFGLTVRENLALGRPGATPEEIRAAAERARVADLIDGLPEKFETVIRKRGKLFSEGEQQRMALARALLRDGRIWVLDEPTTGLDSVAAAQLEEALLDATRGRTTLWVTHHFPTALKMDRIVFLEEGVVKFFGPSDEFARWVRAAAPDEEYLRKLAEQI